MKFWKFAAAVIVFGLVCLLYAYFIERKNIKIEYVTLASEKFSAHFPGMRLVQISDVHIDQLTPFEYAVAQKVNDLNPDAIVITGDFIKHRHVFEGPNAATQLPANIAEIEKFLNLLKAPDIFLCRGNNDFSNDKEVSDIFLERLQANKATVLVNSFATIKKNNHRINLFGVDFPGFSKWEANEFSNGAHENGRCIESGFSFKNSYSHVLIRQDRTKWRDYVYTGRFRQSNPQEGGIGLTFYSQFDQGYDRYYRVRRLAGWSKFVLSPHGAKQHSGVTEFAMDMQANVWYHFKINCFRDGPVTRIQARIWRDGEDEPFVWHADAIDSTNAFENGTIGLWSHGKGAHQFDNLCLTTADGDTLFFDDFEDGDTFGWVDFNFEGEAVPWLRKAVPDSEYCILLGHSPDLVTWADSARIDLFVSGHTHGGQVQLPMWGPLLVGTKLGRKYAEGLHEFPHTTLYVNRGVGTVLLPIRFLCPPEITVFDLQSKN